MQAAVRQALGLRSEEINGVERWLSLGPSSARRKNDET